MSAITAGLPFPALNRKQQAGSKPRCHLLTNGSRDKVAARLSELIFSWGQVTAEDRWMPEGFDATAEAQLHTAAHIVPDSRIRDALASWWLAVSGPKVTTPNWDIASTCTIGDRPGLLLVEAKAHDAELRNEERGKTLGSDDMQGIAMASRRNHVRIGACIEEASLGLSEWTHQPWSLSRDWNYQMSNRFAWAFKLAECGIPVILVYLGFLNCEEMRKGTGQVPIRDDSHWRDLVFSHSKNLFASQIWDTKIQVKTVPLIPLIKTYNQPLHAHESP